MYLFNIPIGFTFALFWLYRIEILIFLASLPVLIVDLVVWVFVRRSFLYSMAYLKHVFLAYKFIARFLSRRCEIERILFMSTWLKPHMLYHGIYDITTHSSLLENMGLKKYNIEGQMDITIGSKRMILSDKHREKLQISLEFINRFETVYANALSTSQIGFDIHNTSHEAKLSELWCLVMSTTLDVSDRVSENWKLLGFQGRDPATDFRGMGIFGLDQLIYFAKKDTEFIRSVISQINNEEVAYYPFSVVGINISKFILDSIENRKINHVIFELMTNNESVNAINELYCLVFRLFHLEWRNSKTDIMMFGTMFSNLQKRVIKRGIKVLK